MKNLAIITKGQHKFQHRKSTSRGLRRLHLRTKWKPNLKIVFNRTAPEPDRVPISHSTHIPIDPRLWEIIAELKERKMYNLPFRVFEEGTPFGPAFKKSIQTQEGSVECSVFGRPSYYPTILSPPERLRHYQGPLECAAFDVNKVLVSGSTGLYFIHWLRGIGMGNFIENVVQARRDNFVRFRADGSLGLAGIPEREVEEQAQKFLHHILLCKDAIGGLPFIFQEILDEIERHRAENRIVVFLSGSNRYPIKALADHLGIDFVIAQQALVKDGIITDFMDTPQTYHLGRAHLLLEYLDALSIGRENLWAYSNNLYLDLPFLFLPQKPDQDNRLSKIRENSYAVNSPPGEEKRREAMGIQSIRFPGLERFEGGRPPNFEPSLFGDARFKFIQDEARLANRN